MKKLILALSTVLSVVYFTTAVKAEGIALTGYMQFFAGSSDQTLYHGAAHHGFDLAGMSDGNYSRLTATADTTLDSGVNVAVVYNLAKDCRATSTANCNISVNQNDVAFTGGFGSINIGNTPGAGTMLHSRLTAAVPTGEPDGGMLGHYHSADSVNSYGSANETGYASNALTVRFISNNYEGFTIGMSHTPNMAENFTGDTSDGQTSFAVGTYSDRNEIVAKYETELDGFGMQFTAGMIGGNSGMTAGVNFNDLNEQVYSARLNYAGFSADWRFNDRSDSGLATANGQGGDQGNSVCGMYTMGAITVGACQVSTDYDASKTTTNTTETNTINAGYNLGGGVNLGAAFFSIDQTADTTTRTDADGVLARLDIGF
jgi:hypothetical protein